MGAKPICYLSLACLVLLGAIGCAGGPVPDRGDQPLPDIRFKSGIDRVAFDFRPLQGGVEVIGRDGRLLVRVEIESYGLTISGPTGQSEIAISVLSDGRHRGYRAKDASGGQILSEVRIEKDGDMRLLGADAALVFKLKRRDYGFKLVDAKGASILRVRGSGDGKVSVRDNEGLTYLQTRDPIPVAATALLSIPGLSFAEATGLAVASWIWPEGRR